MSSVGSSGSPLHQVRGGLAASKWLFAKLWQSSIRIPDTVIVGKNGEIQWYLFYSKNTNSVLRKRSMSKTPQTLREAWGTQIKRPSQNAAPAAHLIARGGKAVVLRSTFDRICQDMQSQEDCLQRIIAAGNVRDEQIAAMNAERKKFCSGPFFATRYVEPAGNSCYTCEFSRLTTAPSNPRDMRMLNGQLDSYSFNMISHNSAYDDLEGTDAELRLLMRDHEKRKVVQNEHSHPVLDQHSSVPDFVKYGVYTRNKKVAISKAMETRLKRAVREIVMHLERHHGHYVTRLKAEFMVATSPYTSIPSKQDSTRGVLYLKSCSLLRWIQAKPLWQLNVTNPELVRPQSAPMWSTRVRIKGKYPQDGDEDEDEEGRAKSRGMGHAPARSLRSLTAAEVTSDAYDNTEEGDPSSSSGSEDEDDGYDNADNLPQSVSPKMTYRKNLQFAQPGIGHRSQPPPETVLHNMHRSRPLARTPVEERLHKEIHVSEHVMRKQSDRLNTLGHTTRKQARRNATLKKKLSSALHSVSKFRKERDEAEAKAALKVAEEKRLRSRAETALAQLQEDHAMLKTRMEICERRLRHYIEDESARMEVQQEEKIASQYKEAAIMARENSINTLQKELELVKESKVRKSAEAGWKRSKAIYAFEQKRLKEGDGASEPVDTLAKKIELMKKDRALSDRIGALKAFRKDRQSTFGQKLGALIDIFMAVDLNCNGYISPDELAAVLQMAGIRLPHAKLLEVAAAADVDGDKQLTYAEFSAAMADCVVAARRSIASGLHDKLRHMDPQGANIVTT